MDPRATLRDQIDPVGEARGKAPVTPITDPAPESGSLPAVSKGPGERVRQLLIASMLGLLAASAAAAAQPGSIRGRCDVKFFGTSTLHDFEGRAPCEAFAVEPLAESGAYRARVVVDVAKLTTGLGARDARMREMFEAARFPQIVASFDRVVEDELRAASEASGPTAPLAFRLAIHGRERSVVPTLLDWEEVPDEQLRLLARFQLSLRDFGLEAPSVLGLMKVDDVVRTEVEVTLTTP
jgi:hypothetical protein